MRVTEAMLLVGQVVGEQWGLLTAAQATAAGVDRVTLTRLTRSGLLEHITRGVYAVPAAAASTSHLAERAAWLRLDPARPAWERQPLDADGGVVSHRSAAALHGLGDLLADQVELTVPRRRTTRDPDVKLRVGVLEPGDVTLVDGLPTTTPTRTVLDLLADHVDGGHIGDVLADARDRGLVDLDALADRAVPHAARYGVKPGADRGRRLLNYLLDQAGRSEPEASQAVAVARQLAGLHSRQLAELSKALDAVRNPAWVDFGRLLELGEIGRSLLDPSASQALLRRLNGSDAVRRMFEDVEKASAFANLAEAFREQPSFLVKHDEVLARFAELASRAADRSEQPEPEDEDQDTTDR